MIVAKNEFEMTAGNPLVIMFMILIFVLAFLNAAGSLAWSKSFPITDYTGTIISDLRNVTATMDGFFVLLTLCIGVISIADERSKGTLSVTLTKPLYRRDILIGKLIGISIFLLVLATTTYVLLVSILIIFYGNAGSIVEVMARVFILNILLFVYCCFTLGLVALFSIILTKGAALIASLVYICYEWYNYSGITSIDPLFGVLVSFDPTNLYWRSIVGPVLGGPNLLDTTFSLRDCLNYHWPYILLLILEVIVIILIDSMLFNREEIIVSRG